MLKLSAHIGYLFPDLPLERRFAAAAQSGFQAVEHPAPYGLDAGLVAKLLRDLGLDFAQLALPMGDPDKGEKGLACLPGREPEFRAALERALDYAETIGCTAVHAMSGAAPAGAAHAALWRTYLANLSHAAEACRARGARLLIEAISAGAPGYFMNDARLALAAIREIGNDNLSLLFDTYHAPVTGLDPASFIRAHSAAIGHLHVADHPGRHEPGTGEIDFADVFRAIDAVGYDGFIGCEYVPLNGTAEGLAWRERFGGGGAGDSGDHGKRPSPDSKLP